MQDTEKKNSYKDIAKNDITLLLQGDKPRLIDEWQEIKSIWNAVKVAIDDNNEDKALFFLTGSIILPDIRDLHSGTGRVMKFTIKPMTLYESGISSGKVSLISFLNKETKVEVFDGLGYKELAPIICKGGWPKTVDKDVDISRLYVDQYLLQTCERDIIDYDNVKRDPKLAQAIIKVYARNVATIESSKKLYADVSNLYGVISIQTVIKYLDILKKLFIIDEIPAWNTNVRSKTSMYSSNKKFFVDPSIAASALGCSPEQLMMDPKTYGQLFENLAARDLSVYMAKNGGSLAHYRDRHNTECDFVLNSKMVIMH